MVKVPDDPTGLPVVPSEGSGQGLLWHSATPPSSPVFDSAPGGANDPLLPGSVGRQSERERIEHLKRLWPQLLKGADHGGRADRFYPFLLVRAVVGDHGDRALSVPFWESPDIWTAAGDPAATPSIPANPGGTVAAGQPNTVYAHVWNLGYAPIAGVRVEFYWFDPSLAIDATHAHLIGVTRVDLGPRTSAGCHRLVKCPQAWVPVFANGGHECLVVRVSSVGDTPTDPWAPWADRHVAQRNVTVVQSSQGLGGVLASLNTSRPPATRVEVRLAGSDAATAVTLLAPGHTLDLGAGARTLARLLPNGDLVLPALPAAAAGQRTAAAAPARTLPRADLLAPALHERIAAIPPPQANTAHVLRFACYRGRSLLGGYTVVVAGPSAPRRQVPPTP